jgi:hypothetical protein
VVVTVRRSIARFYTKGAGRKRQGAAWHYCRSLEDQITIGKRDREFTRLTGCPILEAARRFESTPKTPFRKRTAQFQRQDRNLWHQY